MRIRIQGCRSAAMRQAQTSPGNVVAKTAEPPGRPIEAGLWRSQAKRSDRVARDDPSRPCAGIGPSGMKTTTTSETLGLARPRLRKSKRQGRRNGTCVAATQAAAARAAGGGETALQEGARRPRASDLKRVLNCISPWCFCRMVDFRLKSARA